MEHLFDSASYTESAFSLPIGIVGSVSIAVGLWIVWHERARLVSISFLAAALAIGTYLLGFAFMVRSARYEVAYFWGKLAYVGIPFIVPAIYQFSMDLLGFGRRRGLIIRTAWLIGAGYAILSVGTDVLVDGVMKVEWGYVTRLTPWHLPFIGWSTVLLGLALWDYAAAYRHAEPVQKARIRLFAVPLIIGSIAFIDYAPSLGLPVLPWGFVVFGVYMASAAWAVARYHLPDLTPSFAADQIVRTMAEPLLVCDEAGAIAFANPAAAGLFGCSERSLVGESLATLFGDAPARSLLHEERTVGRELELAGGGAEPVAVAVSTSRIEGKLGRTVGTVVVARDIRERRRAAREIARREQRFRALIEHSRDTITILDRDSGIVYGSPSFHTILGYDPADVVGRSVFDAMHPADRAEIDALIRDLGARPGAAMDAECRIRHARGHYRVFEFRATNLLDHPAVHGIVVNARDVTEERDLTVQLQQAQKMEAIGRLAGGVAHDFNNILTAIQGNVALIQEEIPASAPVRQEVEEIRRGAERAGRLTDQLLAFSRRQVVRAEVLSLNGVVDEMRSMLHRLIGERIEFVTDLGAEPDLIRADRSQLEQIVMNLVVNARDAVGGAGRIELATRRVAVDEEAAGAASFQIRPGTYVQLTVADDGEGMDDDTRSRLFEPFFTTKEAGRGTGLGLSTVYGSVRQADGFIGVDSALGRGTTLSIYFPDAHAAAPGRGAGPDRPTDGGPWPAVAQDAGAEADSAGPGAVVLVVEDEAPVRSLVARVLERRGYQVLQAENGEVALDVAAEHDGPIDLLVADLVMPGLTGRELADRLATRFPDMAIVLISGYTADEVVRHGISTGARDFLPKPFTPDVLVRKVASVLGARRPAASETPGSAASS